MAVIISAGSVMDEDAAMPAVCMIVATSPCNIVNSDIINSRP